MALYHRLVNRYCDFDFQKGEVTNRNPEMVALNIYFISEFDICKNLQ